MKKFKICGYDVNERTLKRWRANYKKYGSSEIPFEKRGRDALLDDVEQEIFAGMILAESEKGIVLHQDDLSNWIKYNMGYECEPQTAGNYARRLGFKVGDFKKGNDAKRFSVDELVNISVDWLKGNSLSDVDPSRVCCIDFTFTSHRMDRVRGYYKKGEPPPVATARPTRFTNLIICASFADGVDRAPPIMFTYNPAFNLDRNRTARRGALEERVQRALNEVRHLGVKREDIIYVDPPLNKKKKEYTYVGERQELLERFLSIRKIPKNCYIFHDDGSVFGSKNSTTLGKLGYENEITFEPCVHQFFSTCDNNWFGKAKKKWRSKFSSFEDDILTSVWLLGYIRETYARVEKRFKKNFLLGIPRPSRVAVRELIEGKSADVREEEEEKKTIYRMFMGMDGRGYDEKQLGNPLVGGLDGMAHRMIKKRRK